MQHKLSGWILPIGLVIAVLLIAAGIWFNLRLAEMSPGGEEFLISWHALRTWFTQGTSPYNPAVRLEAELLAYGRPAQPGEPRLVFTSPIFSAILLFPFALISDYSLARASWMMVLELTLVLTLALSARLAGWKPSRGSWVLLVLFVWLGFYGVHSVLSGSPASIVGLLLVLALLALRTDRLELSGALLALACCFPPKGILVILCVLLWSISSGKGKLAVWMVAITATLSVLGLFFIPDWHIQYLRSLFSFPDQQALLMPASILAKWLPGVGRQLGNGLTILLALILLIEWIIARRKNFGWFSWTVALTLVLQSWIGIGTRISDLVILLFPLVVVLAIWEQRLGKSGRVLALGSLLLLILGLWMLAWNPGLSQGTLGQISFTGMGMLFPFPLFLVTGLYWVRWWAVRPKRMYIDELRSAGH